ncbi:hypothetical protein BBP40_002150 [Aspergillus hancockii]|nr:hypothetical protein BBP40_002150 [Aspergillus hancockii]
MGPPKKSGKQEKTKQSGQSKVNKPKTRSDRRKEQKELESSKATLQKDLDQKNEAIASLEVRLEDPDLGDDKKDELQKEYKECLKFRDDLHGDLMDLDDNLAALNWEDKEMKDVDDPETANNHRRQPFTEQSTETAPKNDRGGPSFSQTKPDNGNGLEFDSDTNPGEPNSFSDIDNAVDNDLSTVDEGGRSDLLDDGITLLKHQIGRSGELSLNSYGPKNSAVLTWSSCIVQREVEDLKWFRGPHHEEAFKRDGKGNYKYKGKIAKIKAVAWQPKRKVRDMGDLLNSVEDINPERKRQNPKYVFPFSTVLVGWKDELDMPQPVWLGRAEYKTLSSGSKEQDKRTDRKFYQMACRQVQNYRNWIGDDRLGRDTSPTPKEETPEPDEEGIPEDRQNSSGKSSGDQNSTDQNPSGKNLSGKNLGDQSSSGQNSSSQNSSSQNSSSQNSSGKNPGGQNSTDQNSSGQNPNSQGKSPQKPKTFSKRGYIANMKVTMGLDRLEEEDYDMYVERMAIVLAKYDLYRDKMQLGGAIEVD